MRLGVADGPADSALLLAKPLRTTSNFCRNEGRMPRCVNTLFCEVIDLFELQLI